MKSSKNNLPKFRRVSLVLLFSAFWSLVLTAQTKTTQTYYGNVGKAEAWFFLEFKADGKVEGYYYNCFNSGKKSQNYTLKGEFLADNTLLINEYTGANKSATLTLHSQDALSPLQKFKGQMRNTDGTTYAMAMEKDRFSLPDFSDTDGQGLHPTRKLRDDALERLQNSVNDIIYFDVSKDREMIVAIADDSPCGKVAYTYSYDWLATVECTTEAERSKLNEAQKKLGYFTGEAATAVAMLKCSTPVQTWYSVFSSKINNPSEWFVLIFDTNFNIQRISRQCD